jgi:hypothetical protein
MAKQYGGARAKTTTCKHCGTRFRLKRSDAEFCSGKCKVAHHRDLKARRSAASGAFEGELAVTQIQPVTDKGL